MREDIVFLEWRKGHVGDRKGQMVDLGSKTQKQPKSGKTRENAKRPQLASIQGLV